MRYYSFLSIFHQHINGFYLLAVLLKGSTKPIVHHLHCPIVQVSLASNSLSLSVYCLSWLLCPLKCACVCVLSDNQPLSSLCSADRRRQKNVSLPESSCFSLIGIQGTQSRPECLLHVPRRNVGNERMERGGREEWAPLPVLSGPKNRKHPPFFSIPSASLFPYPASLPVSPSLVSSHPFPLPPPLSV